MPHDDVARLEDLIARLEGARDRLEACDEPDLAVPILEEMQALAQELGVEVDRRRRLAADEAERDDSQLGLL